MPTLIVQIVYTWKAGTFFIKRLTPGSPTQSQLPLRKVSKTLYWVHQCLQPLPPQTEPIITRNIKKNVPYKATLGACMSFVGSNLVFRTLRRASVSTFPLLTRTFVRGNVFQSSSQDTILTPCLS